MVEVVGFSQQEEQEQVFVVREAWMEEDWDELVVSLLS